MSTVQRTVLANKKVLVTGASSGIGKAVAAMLVQRGAVVCGTGRNTEALAALRADTSCFTVEGDLTKEGVPQSVVEEAVRKMEGITTLVNCAGVLQGGAFGTEACNLDNFKTNFNGNTQSVFEMMVHTIPHLKEAGVEACPSIVNISSVNGLVSFGGVPAYCASKAAVDMLTKCAAVDLAPFGIRVNAVNPGVVVTELHRRAGMDEDAYKAFLKHTVDTTHPLSAALGRPASVDEVARLVSFLISDEASYITGDSIKIDGGRGCVGAR